MASLNKMQTLNARLPSAESMAKAFAAFFDSKLKTRRPVLDTECDLAYKTFQYIARGKDDNEKSLLGPAEISTALRALTHSRSQKVAGRQELGVASQPAIAALARDLFQELVSFSHGQASCVPLAMVLCRQGLPNEARDKLLKYSNSDPSASEASIWTEVLSTFAQSKNKAEVNKTWKMMEQFNHMVSRHPGPIGVMAHFYSQQDDVANAKRCYETLVTNFFPDYVDLTNMRKFCLRTDHVEWGQKMVNIIISRENITKDCWDGVLAWAAATGKGVDEIERMMDVMTRRSNNEQRPDVLTINRLLEVAISKNDPYTAERFISLGMKKGIHPNADTRILQMEYRFAVNDIDGARAAYRELQGEEITDDQDLPVANKLVRSLCTAPRFDFNAIMEVIQHLTDRGAPFEAETVRALCLLHLQRNELDDVIDLLNTHASRFSSSERLYVRQLFVDYCLSRTNNTAQVWDAYMIFQQIFRSPERAVRTRIMQEFFARKRSDMACHVFSHMAKEADPAARAIAETYVQCFVGTAETKDEESLSQIHNMLKLDMSIEPDTRLHNALMLANIACGSPYRALEFWEDITRSREGPSYNSIHLAFRACELAPSGEHQARKIWQTLRKMDVEISVELFTNYVCALAGNDEVAEAAAHVEKMEQELGLKPNAYV